MALLVKNLIYNPGDPGLIPGSGRAPGEGNGELHGQRSWAGYRPWDPKELDMTVQLTFTFSSVGKHKGEKITWSIAHNRFFKKLCVLSKTL